MVGVLGRREHSAKAVVIRDASTIPFVDRSLRSNQLGLESLGRQPDSDVTGPTNGGDVAAEQTVAQEPESHPTDVYVDFLTLGSILGEWQPSDPNIARVAVVSELVGLLRAKRIQTHTGRGPDILVCDRYPVNLERGNKPTDVDRLLEKMIWDSHIYGCVIGVAYGVQDQLIVEQLECVLEEFFEKQDMATIVLC